MLRQHCLPTLSLFSKSRQKYNRDLRPARGVWTFIAVFDGTAVSTLQLLPFIDATREISLGPRDGGSRFADASVVHQTVSILGREVEVFSSCLLMLYPTF